MKRKRIIFAVIMVNIALLTSILVPHHHHKGGVCFTSMHSQTDCDAYDNGNAEHHQHKKAQKHDSRDTEDHQNCLMDLEIIVPTNQEHDLKIAFSLLEDQLNFDIGSALTASLEKSKDRPPIRQVFSLLIVQQYCFTVIQSRGLRAPPLS